MSHKYALVPKRRQDLNSKLKDLKDEGDSVLKYVENIMKQGTVLATDLGRETDNAIFLRRYPRVIKELDKLVNKIVQLNCTIGLGASDDEAEEGTQDDSCVSVQTFTKSEIHNYERLTPENSIQFSTAQDVRLVNEPVQVNCDLGPCAIGETEEGALNEPCVAEQTAQDVRLVNEPLQVNCDLGPCAIGEAEEGALNEPCVAEQTLLAVHSYEQLASESSTTFSDADNVSPSIHDDSLALEPTQSTLSKNALSSCPVRQGEILDMSFLHGNSPYNFWLCYYSSQLLEYLNETMLSRYLNKQLRPFRMGTYACAFNGKTCFRGKVLKIRLGQPAELMVLDVDSGRIRKIEQDRVFKLDEDLLEIPAQALNCRLKGDLGDPALWNDQVTPLFHKVLTESALVVTVSGKIKGEPPQFLVEIDCHNEKRMNSTIELNKWIMCSVLPKLEEIKESSTGDGILKFLFTYLDSAAGYTGECTENKLYSCPSTQISNSTTSCPETAVTEHSQSHIKSEGNPASVQQMEPTPRHKRKESASPLNMNLHVSSEVTSHFNSCPPQTVCDHSERNIESLCVNKDNTRESTLHQPADKNIYLHQAVRLSSVGQKYNAMLAHVEDPSEFYIHIVCEDNIEIDNLQNRMTQCYGTDRILFKSKAEARYFVSLFCAAFYDVDEKWYRAKIIDWNQDESDQVSIMYVDYGNMTLVHFSMLQPLRNEFTNLPVCATKCSLAMIQPTTSTHDKMSNSWSQESAYSFKCLVNMQSIYSVILVESSDDSNCSLPVLLQDCQDGDSTINELMVEFGYAVSFFPKDRSLYVTQDPKTEESPCREVHPVLDVTDQVDGNVTSDWKPMSEDYYSEINTIYHDDEDSCYVVTGYNPQDESKVCKLYAQNGRCFKGEICRKEHRFLNPDGWTTDREIMYIDSFSRLVLPDVEDEILLQVTHIIKVNLFYAVICDVSQNHSNRVQIKRVDAEGDEDDEREETLLTLSDYMNQGLNVRNMQRCAVMPALGQIVVARYSKDGRFYRARVVDYSDTQFCVFYVDYGNKEWVSDSDIRAIEQKYLHLPFQAIECALANVDDVSESKEAHEFFASLVYNKTLYARVIAQVSCLPRLEVLLLDEGGFDVGDHIVRSDYGRARICETCDVYT